jgi:hypothetical protein
VTDERPRISSAVWAALALLGTLAAVDARADWPAPAVRSGTHLPADRELAVAVELAGAYVPEATGLASDSTALFQGSLIWNFAPFDKVGLFGEHGSGGMRWANVGLLILTTEAGVRYLALQHLAFEVAYLTHRVDRVWVDDFESNPGGVIDRGVELGTWLRLEPHRRLLLETHLIGRVFEVYRDIQGVTGLGLRLSISPWDGHAFVVELEALRVVRQRPRTDVDRITWNTLGRVAWRAELSEGLGLEIGARVSAHLLVGEVPMLELKRSMIDEPMAMGFLGLWFGI